MATVGILALQGDFAAHLAAFGELGAVPLEVRRPHRLDDLDGLVIPGGESTTLLNLMGDEPWFEALAAFHARGGKLFGTCAGAILLAREVRSPDQPSLGLLDAVVERNGYGRQIDSFETRLELDGESEPLPAVFIRAPRFVSLGPEVRVLASHAGEPVLVSQDNVLAATFHPELTPDRRLHRRFLNLLTETKTDSRREGVTESPPGPVAVERRITC